MLRSLFKNTKLFANICVLFTAQFFTNGAIAQTNICTWTGSSTTANSGIAGNSGVATITSNAGTWSGAGFTTYCSPSFKTSNMPSGDYYQVSFKTTGYQNINVNLKVAGSSTGPRDFEIQYSLDGSTWNNLSGGTYSITGSSSCIGPVFGTAPTFPSSCNNLATLYVRWTVADGTSIGGGSIGSSGTNYLANLTFTGTVLPSSTVAISSTDPGAFSWPQGSTNVILESFPATVGTSAATLTGLTVNTAGTYASADITNIKCWYSTSSSSITGITPLSTLTTPGVAGSKVFPSFTSQSFPVGTEYIYITADIAPGATIGDKINLNATPVANFTFTGITPTGSTSAASTQTIVANTACTGTSSGTVTPTSSTFCGSGSQLLTLNGGYVPGPSGITYQWYASPSGTAGTYTVIPSATSSTYSTPTVSSTTYYECTTTCSAGGSSTSTVGVASVNPIPSISITSPSGGTGSSCSGSGLAISVTGATSYSSAPASGLSATTGSSVTATPSVTSTYTVTGTDNGCSSINTVTATYALSPTALTISPASLMVCQGTAVNSLTATGGNVPGVATYTNTTSVSLSSGSAVGTSAITSTVPAGATITGVSVTLNFGSSYLSDYIFNLKAPDGSIINLINQEGPHSTGNFTNTVLTSAGGAALSGGSTPFTGTFAADLQTASIPGYSTTATAWAPLYTTPAGSWVLAGYNTYTGTNSGSSITSWILTINYTAPVAPTWSPTVNLFTNAGGTTNYAGTALSTVYDNPVTSGITTYTATVTNAGCATTATATVTVNPTPSAILGSTNVCLGGISSLSDAATGGTWSTVSANVSVDGSGNVSGITGGTGTITYALPTGCMNTVIVTVNPSAISGSSIVCLGSTTTLTDVATGGTWQSTNTAVGTIGLTTGVAGGIATGTTVISYTYPGGCIATTTLSALTTPDPITGTGYVCTGSVIALTDPGGGTWSSSSNATVGSSSGLVFGVTAGTATIIYTITCGSVSTVVTINPLPDNITGATTVCLGSTTTLGDITGSGTWSSTNGTVASIDGSGDVTGNTSGTSTISYTIATGCAATYDVTVNPSVITGTQSLCVGSTTVLHDATTGGTWSSGATSVATVVVSTGVVSGVAGAGGTATIYYTSGGCTANAIVTVNPLPSIAFTPTAASVCAGGSGSLITASGASAYTWSPNSALSATTGASVTANPTANTIYTVAGTSSLGCVNTNTVTANYNLTPSSLSISPTTYAACQNSTVELFTATGGTVGPTSGYSTGSISFPHNAAVTNSTVITGIPASASITSIAVYLTLNLEYQSDNILNLQGPNNNIISLFNGNGSNSSFAGVIEVSSAGTTSFSGSAFNASNVYKADLTTGAGPSGSTSNITAWASLYSGVPNGTWTMIGDNSYGSTPATLSSYTITVNYTYQAPVTWMPTLNLFTNPGGTTNYTGTATNTVYDNPLTPGTVTYTATASNNGCTSASITTVTVNPLPNAGTITGSTLICGNAATTTLADLTTGGVWSSTNTAVATVSGGVVTSAATGTGTTTISYTIASLGCTSAATMVVTVNAIPTVGSITGSNTICGFPANTALTDLTPGGAWTSTNTGVANISSGLVTSAATGTTTISYSVTMAGCTGAATEVVTVNPAPVISGIGGTASVCAGSITSLNDATTGGAWSNDASGNGTVDGSGNVTGINAGNVTVTYSLANGSGCTSIATTTVTVNPVPAVPGIGGTASVCVASITSLNDATTGGIWGNDASGNGTVDGSGNVAGIDAGTVNITYSVTNGTGCTAIATTTVTVNPLPVVLGISGTASVCAGSVISLNDATVGGVWSNDASGNGTVDGSGNVTGINVGNGTVTYSLTNGSGCTNITTTVVTVNPVPVVLAIGGTASVCAGSVTSLNDATAGGVWSNDASGNGTVDGSGNVTGVNAGNVTVTYSVTNGFSCTTIATAMVTVNALPVVAAITGANNVCYNSLIILEDATTGASMVWESSNPSTASVAGGEVIGLIPGTTTISYSVTDINGCTGVTSTLVTVNALPEIATISGPGSICLYSSVSLGDATTGVSSSWVSTNPSVASVTSAGIVTGEGVGGATIIYLMTDANGCSSTAGKPVTVNGLPVVAGISGTFSVCAGSVTSLANATTGGVWSNDVSGDGTVDATGNVTGINAGTATISYMVTSGLGCPNVATAIVTINPLPTVNTITGTLSVCASGPVTSLADATAGGVWSATSTHGSVDASGNVTGLTAGTVNVTYTVTNGYGCTNFVTAAITVNPLPTVSAITGVNNVCLNATIILGDATTGVSTIWSSSASGTAPVTSGSVLGAAAGNAVITYSVTDINGCTNITTKAVTVNPLPTVSAISGLNIVCTGATITLSDAPTGGVWSSNNIAAATAGSSSGLVMGVAAGSAVISYVYTDINSCQNSASAIVTVNPQPTAILGTSAICIGSVASLSDAVTGGSWSNSNSNGTVDASGNVTGMTAGMVMISYAFPGCYATAVVTVNSLPGIITGTVSSVCVGTTTTLSDATVGGTWSSANTSIATVGSSSRIVTGVSDGATTIIYTMPTGCSRSYTITVNTVNPVTGSLSVCSNVLVTLNDAMTGGMWTSGNTAKAAIGSVSGIVTGVSAGTSIITYQSPVGCQATAIVTVNVMTNILGTAYLCANGNTSLSDAAAGGTWSVSPSGIATVGTSGSVSGVSAGTATVSYTNATTGCASGVVITVNAMSAILGTPISVCVGGIVTLNDATSGGTWSSSAIAKATAGSASGLVSGLASGTSTISYIISATGCNATTVVTVNPTTPILGVASVCTGLSTSLSDATTGGVWSNDVTGNGTVSVSGAVTGVTAGTATISYTIGATGCASGVVVMVNQTPTILSAPVMVCAGSSSALNVDVTGGTWSSTLIAKASIGSASGIINGVAAGTTTISYTAPTGCKTATTATVNVQPSVITGIGSVCTGSTIALADASTGGVWSNDVTGNGTVDGSGNVTGITAGTVIISYTNGSNCSSTIVMTVNQLPSSFAGASVCAGSTTTLSTTPSGGVWSSSSAAIATVGSTSGVLTGVSGGTANIMYATGSGCVASAVVSVNTILPITGGTSVCTGGGTTFLADASTGGTWSTSDVTINVDPTGVVTPLSAGTGTVTYAYLGCTRSVVISVNPPPAITGTYSVCLGTATTLTGNGTGGTWSGSNAVIAMVGGTTGIVTGANLGTATITYASGPGAACIATQVVTVEASVTSISGVSKVCFGLVATLSDATTGGTWSSNNPVIGSVDGSGNVLGVSAGSTTISYRDIIGCYTLHTFTVNPLPAAILGTTTVCAGSTTTLSDATSGAVSWTSSNTSAATVTGGGVVTTSGSGSGQSTTITYAVASGCTITTTVSVITGPVMITNNVAICPGSSELLSDGTPGGSWSSSNTSVAAIGTDGTVSGLGSGNTTISYMLAGAGCQVGVVVTVAAVPPVTGTLSLCAGSTTMLNNTVSGGTWSTVSGTVSVGSSTGIVSGGASAATATVSYTTPVGCVSSAVVTVNGLPGLSGTMSLCGGAVTTLTATLSGGTWSGGNAHATVDGSGDVTGIASGTASVTYTSAAGCVTSSVVTVNIAPGAVSGITSICAGATTTLTDATAGGVWSSSNAAINIGSSSGVITGSTAATSTIAYTTGAGCVSSTVMSVNEAPGLVTGTTVVCAGVTVTLSESSTDGTWSSSNGNATVDGSGDVTGTSGATGAVTISYALGDGCTSTLPLSVVLPPSAISGNTSMCPGTMATLSDIPSGGTWSSSASGVASVGSLSGVVTAGGASGTATIVYNVGNGCPAASAVITVYAAPSAIGGTLYVCLGATTTLTGDFGGIWSSSNSLNASVGSSSGIVTGVSLSTASITYTAATGCKLVNVVTVNAVPQIISGPASVCLGSTTMLTDATTGGVWSSTGTAGSVDASGNITGITAGMFTVNYTLGSCPVSRNITVNAPPSAIQGVATICAVGLTTNLSDATSGAVSWSSDNTANATVNGGGVVTGVALGTATIRYTVNTGCSISTIVTVGVTAISISGNAPVCPSGMLTLSDATGTVGAWSSTNTGVATVGTSSGTVTGVAGGTATISYVSGSTGCKAAVIVTVNPILPITGTATACIGSSSKLADATTGGTWSSSATGIASVGSSTGIVTGGSGGVANITYLTAAGCSAVATVTINPISTTISGPSALCTGSTITFTDATTGGTWSSGNTVIATVGASTGLVTPANAGTVNISYSISGCSAVQLITVSTATGNIAGVVTVCAGATTLLTDATTGGVWSNTGTAGSVSATGNVTGITAGTITVSYLVGSCGVSRNVTVNPLPSGIGGNAWVCAGSTTALSDATTGATGWASSNTTFATVNGGGVVTGVAAGTSTIKYSIASGCSITTVVTVNGLPSATISGPSSVASGGTITLVDATTGGTWASSNHLAGTIGSVSGIVTGIASSGTTTISYTTPANSSGCIAKGAYTVTATPAPPHHGGSTVSGTTTLYVGSTASIIADVISGVWSSSNTQVATVDEGGLVTGVAPGVASITHVITNNQGDAETTVTPVVVSSLPIDVRVVPNPNSGTFTVKGILGTTLDEEVSLEITDVLGQVIYKSQVTAQGGRINETISLSNTLANGMYLLNVSSGTEKKVFHFVIEK